MNSTNSNETSQLETAIKGIEEKYELVLDREKFLYVLGDIRPTHCNRLFQQNNCVTRHAKHLALTMAKAFPQSDVYTNRTEPSKPGTYVIKGNRSSTDPIFRKEIVCLFAQYYPGASKYTTGIDSRMKRLEYLNRALNAYIENEVTPKQDGDHWAVPLMLGCGAAAGRFPDYYAVWNQFIDQVHLICPNTTLTFYIYPEQSNQLAQKRQYPFDLVK